MDGVRTPTWQVASSRYAPHLSSCLGLTGSTRRAAARGAAAGAGASAGASGSGGSGWGGWGNVKTGRWVGGGGGDWEDCG